MYLYYVMNYMDKIEAIKRKEALENKTNIKNDINVNNTVVKKQYELNEIFINYIKSSNIFKNLEKYFNK